MTEITEMLLLAKANPFCVFPFFDPRSSSLATDLLSSSNATRPNESKLSMALAALSVRHSSNVFGSALAAPSVRWDLKTHKVLE